MSSPRTVLEHLLDSRDALLLEVTRLTTAIDELDSVIVRIGGEDLRSRLMPVQTTAGTPEASGPVQGDHAEPSIEAEADGSPPAGARPRRAVEAGGRNRAQASVAARRRVGTTATGQADGQKSIRVHVLDMLSAEDREFGLAEIIDRVHAEGVQAHDDAVRSITIKLMKDGKVERVGRGQYRLTPEAAGSRRSDQSAAVAAVEAPRAPIDTPTAEAPTSDAPTSDAPTPSAPTSDAPTPSAPPAAPAQQVPTAPAPTTAPGSAPSAVPPNPFRAVAGPVGPTAPGGPVRPGEPTRPGAQSAQSTLRAGGPRSPSTSLNLGRPWERPQR